jgi:hypothetical protein
MVARRPTVTAWAGSGSLQVCFPFGDNVAKTLTQQEIQLYKVKELMTDHPKPNLKKSWNQRCIP